ncbi:hypothetical protein [Microvirga roseola]|uniref:hypothetical protein n=1 Tax=Microvirga roseola TaxID=2883126 RepID=UPI001E5DBA7D|nr:hypothetical protein [Microvirga roseola]
MKIRSLLPFAAALALVACGEEQTAEAPVTPAPPPTETAEAPPVVVPEPVTPEPVEPVTPAPATPPAATAEVETETVVVAPAETTGNVNLAPSTDATQTAATSATSLEPFQGRTYAAGPLTIQLNPDNTFVMNEAEGNRRVEGRYAFENGVVTFSDPTGDIGPAQFPMRCRFEATGTDEFRLADNEGACTRFNDLTFRPSAG